MSDATDPTQHGHGGDAGTDEPDVGQTSAEDLEQDAQGSAARDDDMASGHIGEPGGPAWARTDDEA